MRVSAKLTLLLIGAAASISSCLVDRAGRVGASTEGAMGGGAMTTSTANGTGGADATTSSATGAAPVCGDLIVESGEDCDDGNLAFGDGCSPTCTIEPLEACPGLPVTLAPPGITIAGNLAGDHDDLHPSCGANQLDVVYEITPTVSGTLVATLAGTYEKSLSIRSSCADSATAELACNSGAGDLSVSRWVYAGVKYHVVVDAKEALFSLQLTLSKCGDGAAQGLEECDNPADPSCVGCFKCAGPGEVFDPDSRHCYRLFANDGVDWKTARSKCLVWGGDLVGISSSAELGFLATKFDNVWSGANDIAAECDYRWSNGEPWQPHWRLNEPNNSGGNSNCGVFFNSGDMDDRDCDEHHDALCERAPGGGCGDGAVQPGEQCDDAITSVGFTCQSCVIKCPQGQIEDPATHHCYEIVTSLSTNWASAQAACASKGSYLAAINTPAESGMLQAVLGVPVWIGASRTGVFRWVNTDPLCFVNWAGGEPSAAMGMDCVKMQANGTWTNDLCDENWGYVCEHDN